MQGHARCPRRLCVTERNDVTLENKTDYEDPQTIIIPTSKD
jgi:hypothetical protein